MRFSVKIKGWSRQVFILQCTMYVDTFSMRLMFLCQGLFCEVLKRPNYKPIE